MGEFKKRLLIRFFACFVGLFLGFWLIEFTVRIFFTEPILPRHVVDSGFGVRWNEANLRSRQFLPGEYDVQVSTNEWGMRGKHQYTREKERGVHRIALVGDSMVYGYGVKDEDVVSHQLSKMLNEAGAGDTRYEVLNFGVSGFGQAEQLVLYQSFMRSFQPDSVVLFYFTNDIGNNQVSSLFRLNDDGTVSRDKDSYLPGVRARELLFSFYPTRWLFINSQAWNLVRNRLSNLVQKLLLKKAGLKAFTEATPEGNELTRALFKKFIDEIQSDGATASVFLIPRRKMQTNFPLTREEIQAWGAKFIDGREIFDISDFYKKDPHINKQGHYKAAIAISGKRSIASSKK